MPKDVLITPASGLIDFKDTAGVSDATIQLDDLGNLNITNSAGVLSIGNTAANLYVGDGTNSVDIIFEQSGKIRALTNKTLTLGQSDSFVSIASPTAFLSPDGTKSITARMLNTDVLSFQGGAGELLSLSDSMTGTIYSVNDVSGIPSIEVLDTGLVKLTQYSGNVLLGTGTDNATDKLQVNGSVTSTILKSTVATGTAPLTVASTTTVSNLSADLLDGLHLNTSGRADIANQVVRTDANGYIQAGWINTTSGDNGTTAINRVYASSDDYIRYYSLANFGSQLTNLNASNLASGTVPTARLGTGTANSTTYLRGDNTWATVSGGATVNDDTTTNATRYIVWEDVTSGSSTTIGVSSTKLYFNPSTGVLNSTSFNSLSDENQKQNVTKIQNATGIINKIDGVEFDWRDNNKHSAGVIAQQLETILPWLVATSEDGIKSVNYSGIIGYLIEAVKELSDEVNQLKNK